MTFQLDFDRVHSTMATNADQRKWRPVHISVVWLFLMSLYNFPSKVRLQHTDVEITP